MIDPRALRRWLLLGVVVVAALGLASEIVHAKSTAAWSEALLPYLSLSGEANVPTWFSSSVLLVCALVAGAIARARPPQHRHWWGIAVMLAYMSLDEAVQIHEHLGDHFGTSGVLYYDWVIPAVAFLAVLAVIYLPFVRRLAPQTRNRLLLAAAIYLAGAVVMELPLGWFTQHYGDDTLGYALIDWVEETLEMIGAVFALVALVQHQRANTG